MIGSLRGRLTLLTLTCIGVVMLPLLVVSYVKVVEEVNELSDARLAQSAKTLEALSMQVRQARTVDGSVIEVENWHRPKGSEDEATPQGHGYEKQVGLQYWATPADLRLTSQDLRDLSFDAAPVGFADIVKDRRLWRVYTKIEQSGGFVRAAERYDSRREIARDLLLQNTLPILVGLPILALLVGWAVRRGLQPLVRTTAQLEGRSPEQVGPIDGRQAPLEVEPLIRALNGLLQRLRRVLDDERTFTSNAAHELRTPLAGALIHLENSLVNATDRQQISSLSDAKSALTRMARLVNQMLELARWDGASALRAFSDIDLAQCVDEELLELAGRALERNIEVVRRIDPGVKPVRGWEAGMRVLIRNLIDNALRYSTHGGSIVISLGSSATHTILSISDDGPGIAPELRESMFNRFQRGGDVSVEGSGLGLPIARRIAELHRATLALLDTEHGNGLRVEVRFPRQV
jgi:two-component system, OmpR family, sensor histidine kinase QseC